MSLREDVVMDVKEFINDFSFLSCNVKIILSLLTHHFPSIPVLEANPFKNTVLSSLLWTVSLHLSFLLACESVVSAVTNYCRCCGVLPRFLTSVDCWCLHSWAPCWRALTCPSLHLFQWLIDADIQRLSPLPLFETTQRVICNSRVPHRLAEASDVHSRLFNSSPST